MKQETFALSQKELQRVAVISSCVKGDLTCARAAELVDLTPAYQASQSSLSARQRSRSGTRQPRPVQPTSIARTHACSRRAAGTNSLCGLQRSPSLREALWIGRLFSRSRDSPSAVALRRNRLP